MVRKKVVRLALAAIGALGAVAVAGAVVGATTSVPVMEVKRETTAPRVRVWELWADAPNRTGWDEGLEYARLDGPFRESSTGEVKLKGQPARRFLITRCEPMEGYTDRFILPLGGKMDWHHSMRETGGGLEVTFEVEVSGPTALILAPVMKKILRKELPPTVDKLVSLAEEA